MASAKIEDRQKFLGGPWDVIKGKNPVLTKGLFKPPLEPLVDKYDKDLADYQSLLTKKKTLRAFFEQQDTAYANASQTSEKLHAEFDKAKADEDAAANKNSDQLVKLKADDDPDPKDVLAAFSGLAAAFEDAATVRKTIQDKLTTLNASMCAQIKKIGADYKTQSDAILNSIKKLEASLNSLDDQIRKVLQTYQQIAVKTDNTDAADAARGLLTFLP